MATKQSKGEPRYQVPRELIESLAFRSLPSASKLLWYDLMGKYRGNNNGNINAALSELKDYGWRSGTTIAKGLLHLIAHGFLMETREGGIRAGSIKKCCLYGFTHLPIHENSKLDIKGRTATYAYRNYDPKKHAAESNLTLQKMKHTAPNNEAYRST
jgi:hypothetical protein